MMLILDCTEALLSLGLMAGSTVDMKASSSGKQNFREDKQSGADLMSKRQFVFIPNLLPLGAGALQVLSV